MTTSLRVTLGQAGDFSFENASLAAGALGDSPTIVVSPCRVDSRDLLLRHKTTTRALYDSELARVMAAGHFDAVFLNEKDQLTEGARSNLFVERGGILLTPPLEAGVLNGVLRQRLLSEGKAREAHLGLLDAVHHHRDAEHEAQDQQGEVGLDGRFVGGHVVRLRSITCRFT